MWRSCKNAQEGRNGESFTIPSRLEFAALPSNFGSRTNNDSPHCRPVIHIFQTPLSPSCPDSPLFC